MNEEDYKFIADEMLGKLAKWLRAMGYDTIYYNGGGDDALVQKSLEEDRIILTRDTHLIERKLARRAILIQSDDPKEQLKQVVEELGLKFGNRLFTRCLICNHEVFAVEKGQIQTKVPEYTYQTHNTFYECSGCGRIYWPGTHKDNMLEFINSVISQV